MAIGGDWHDTIAQNQTSFKRNSSMSTFYILLTSNSTLYDVGIFVLTGTNGYGIFEYGQTNFQYAVLLFFIHVWFNSHNAETVRDVFIVSKCTLLKYKCLFYFDTNQCTS